MTDLLSYSWHEIRLNIVDGLPITHSLTGSISLMSQITYHLHIGHEWGQEQGSIIRLVERTDFESGEVVLIYIYTYGNGTFHS